MRNVVVMCVVLAALAIACDRGGPAASGPAPLPTVAAPTTTTLPGCEDDLVRDVRDLIQDQLAALSGMTVAEVAAGGADAPGFREREAELATALTAAGCDRADLAALLLDEIDELRADGPAAERYLAIVVEAISTG